MVIVQKKGGGTWWKCLLAFFGGILFTIGAVVGGVAIAGTQLTTGQLLGEKADEFVRPEYKSKTIYQIVTEAMGGQIDLSTFGGIDKVTPVLSNVLDDINSSLEANFSFTLDKDTFFAFAVNDIEGISNYFSTEVKNIKLSGLLHVDPENPDTDPFMLKLCYNTHEVIEGKDVYSDPVTLSQIIDDSSFFKTKLNEIKISDVLKDTSGNALLEAIKDKTFEELQEPDAFDDIKIGDVVGEGSENSLLDAIKDKTLKDLKEDDAFDDITIGDAVGDTSGNDMLSAIKDKTFGELKEPGAFDDVKVSEVLTITDESSKILKTFRDKEVTIGNMGEEIDNLLLKDVFEYDEDNPETLPPVLRKLVGNEDDKVEITAPFTYELNWDEYENFILSDGGEEATSYLNCKDYWKNTGLEVTYDDEEKMYVGTGTGSTSANEEFENYELSFVKPASWEHLYIQMCNKPCKVNDIKNNIDDLKLKDVINLEADSPLQKLKNEPIKDGKALFEKMKDTFTVDDIFPDTSENKFLKYVDKDTKVSEIGSAINNLKVLDVFDGDIYAEDGDDIPNNDKIKATWKYLLVEKDESTANLSGDTRGDDPFNKTKYVPASGSVPSNVGTIVEGKYVYKCNDYTIGSSMGKMIDNMQWHMEHEPLLNLSNDGIITFDDTTFLEDEVSATFQALITDPAVINWTEIAAKDPKGEGKARFGALNMNQFVNLMSKVTTLVPLS